VIFVREPLPSDSYSLLLRSSDMIDDILNCVRLGTTGY
jgi:hypothetical protein